MAFKDETAGLVTRADFIQKRQTIAQRLEADQIKRKRVAEDALAQVPAQSPLPLLALTEHAGLERAPAGVSCLLGGMPRSRGTRHCA